MQIGEGLHSSSYLSSWFHKCFRNETDKKRASLSINGLSQKHLCFCNANFWNVNIDFFEDMLILVWVACSLECNSFLIVSVFNSRIAGIRFWSFSLLKFSNTCKFSTCTSKLWHSSDILQEHSRHLPGFLCWCFHITCWLSVHITESSIFKSKFLKHQNSHHKFYTD